MTLSLDHIVIAVSDLEAARRDYAALGFNPIVGGEHANGITHNVLVILADGSYLELIAWKRPDPGNRWSDVYHDHGEGLVDYALLPDTIADAAAGARARGLDLSYPVGGARERPDGARLEWETARSARPDIPFLCADLTPRGLRVPEDEETRRQPNGVTGVAGITVAVCDLAESARRNAALLGREDLPPVAAGTILGTPAETVSFPLPGGETTIRLAHALGPGPLADLLATRGEGPVAISFAGGGGTGDLDPALTHGARLSRGG